MIMIIWMTRTPCLGKRRLSWYWWESTWLALLGGKQNEQQKYHRSCCCQDSNFLFCFSVVLTIKTLRWTMILLSPVAKTTFRRPVSPRCTWCGMKIHILCQFCQIVTHIQFVFVFGILDEDAHSSDCLSQGMATFHIFIQWPPNLQIIQYIVHLQPNNNVGPIPVDYLWSR